MDSENYSMMISTAFVWLRTDTNGEFL